jgi:hypothetical protein
LCPEERRRRDADDREGTPFDVEDLPDDALVTGEPPLPIAVADDSHGIPIRVGERPPDHRADAEHRVVASRHRLSRQQFGFPVHADERAQGWTERRKARQYVEPAG